MKKTMPALMMALFALSALSASALTIVRQDGSGGAKTTIAAAIAAEPDGGSIEIQQFSGPFHEDLLQLSWRSLTSTTPVKPTIIFSQYNGLWINHGSVSNLILKGTSNGVWERGLCLFGAATASNIEIYGFDSCGVDAEIPAGSTASISDVTVGGAGNYDGGCIAIGGTGNLTIDHCTLVGTPNLGTSFAAIDFTCNSNGECPTYTASNVTIKNTIMKGCDLSIGAYYLSSFAPVHKYNDLFELWTGNPILYNADATHLALDSTEKHLVNPVFIDAANSNYGIKGSSTLVGAGENGFNIGADTLAAATQFGMDYMPYLNGADAMQFLCNRNWTAATKAMVEADLNQMNSMGITCQRLMFFEDGWVISVYPTPSYFSSDFTEIIANLPQYLAMCAARNIKLVVCLDSGWLDGTNGSGTYWWQVGYGVNGWSAYMGDVQYFVTSIVNAIENSPYASTVLYYDIHNEIYTQRPNNTQQELYMRAFYDNGWIPASKIGFSVLSVPPSGTTDYDTLLTSTWLGSTRAANTKLTDSHSYPEVTTNDWNVSFKYGKARSTFPNSTTIVGEYSWPYAALSGASETAQATNEITLMNNIISAAIPYAMHWMWIDLYGHTPTYGWFRNCDINQPNDIVGAVGNKLSLLSNGDMEQGNSQYPTGWSGGSNGGHALTFQRVNGQDFIGNYYYRLSVSQAPDNIYTISPLVNVPPCSKIYVNAYVRGANNISLDVHEYDANGNDLGYKRSPVLYSDTQWKVVSWQQAIGGWVCPANPATRKIIVAVDADVTSYPGYLDTDGVTLSVR